MCSDGEKRSVPRTRDLGSSHIAIPFHLSADVHEKFMHLIACIYQTDTIRPLYGAGQTCWPACGDVSAHAFPSFKNNFCCVHMRRRIGPPACRTCPTPYKMALWRITQNVCMCVCLSVSVCVCVCTLRYNNDIINMQVQTERNN